MFDAKEVRTIKEEDRWLGSSDPMFNAKRVCTVECFCDGQIESCQKSPLSRRIRIADGSTNNIDSSQYNLEKS